MSDVSDTGMDYSLDLGQRATFGRGDHNHIRWDSV
jgi:hypothetical protein